jgi:hypothetical protein
LSESDCVLSTLYHHPSIELSLGFVFITMGPSMMSGTSTQNGGADQAGIQRRESFASADSHTAKEYALYLNFVAGAC